jgi:hypothetical protein
VSNPMPADRERETEQVETAIASLRAAVVDDNTLAEWFRPGYLLEVANLLDRLRGDAARKAQLPGSLHPKLTSFAVQPRHARGRVDDCILNVTDVKGTHLGTLTVGWFRQHTDLAEWEAADEEVNSDSADATRALAAAIDRARSTPGGET